MQTFKTRFTADVTQHTRAMGVFRAQTCAAVAGVRNQLLSLGALSIGGLGIKEISESIIKLGADMEQTKVAFEVMLGGAGKAKKVLGELVHFADVTPFDTAEIIQSGRALMACGVQTDKLTNRLELLGNIAAGTRTPINEMVAIYAKMANKGRVQTEELNQMAERGIPIYRLLRELLEVNQNELSKMAEGGMLSFRLIEEAFERLGGAGGQYFGLIEKQSKTLGGLWSTLNGNIKLMGTNLGELLLPELAANIDSVIKKLDELKASGELEALMRKTADAVILTLNSLKELAVWLVKNREAIFSTGQALAYVYAWTKINKILLAGMNLFGAIPASAAGFRRISPVLKLLTTDCKRLFRAMGGLKSGILGAAAAGATFFAGWKIGEAIAQMLELEDVFTRMMLKANGQNPNSKPDEKAVSDVRLSDYAKNLKRTEEIKKELAARRKELANIERDGGANKKSESAAVKNRIAALEKEAAGITAAQAEYDARVKAAFERSKGAAAREKVERDKLDKFRKDANDRLINTKGKVIAPNGMVMDMPGQFGIDPKKKLEEKEAAYEKLRKQNLADRKTIEDYRANKKNLADAKQAGLLTSATASSAAAEAREKRRLAAEKSMAEARKRLSDEKKKLSKAEKDLEYDKKTDAMSEKIKGWQKEIAKYRKEIKAAEKMLGKLGMSVDEDILKTPEQIARDRRDEVLKRKIDAFNRGGSVQFSEDEKARIAELKKAQTSARNAKAGITGRESNVEKHQNALDALARERQKADWKEKASALIRGKNAVAEAGNALKGKKPGESAEDLLKKIADILKKGLPGETT